MPKQCHADNADSYGTTIASRYLANLLLGTT